MKATKHKQTHEWRVVRENNMSEVTPLQNWKCRADDDMSQIGGVTAPLR